MAQSNTGENIKIGLQIGLAVVGFIALKKIGEFLGVFKSKEDEKTEQALESADADSTTVITTEINPYIGFNKNYFSALVKAYYKQFNKQLDTKKNSTLISGKSLIDLAKQVYDSKRLLNDDMEQLYDVFSSMQTQYQLSSMSFLFSSMYKTDLLTYIKSFSNNEELQTIFNKVKNYKQYLK